VKDLKTEFTPRKLIVSGTRMDLIVGSTQAFTATAEFLDGHTEDVTNQVTLSAADARVASVQPGMITAIEKGDTTIHAEFAGKMGNRVAAEIEVHAAYRDPFKWNKAEQFDTQRGIGTERSSEGGDNICNIQDGDWVCFKALDFGAGATAAEFRVASATSGGTIEVRLDAADGSLAGACQVSNTGGWQSWIVKTCGLSDVQGRHDVFFKFVGGPGYLLNVYDWRFTK
jgi:hypothetical protein